MLTEKQMDSLTSLSLRFDGMPGLTHKSIAERVGISQDTVEVCGKLLLVTATRLFYPTFVSDLLRTVRMIRSHETRTSTPDYRHDKLPIGR